MKSAPSNYSECKFSAKSNNFLKNHYIRGEFFNIFGVKNATQGANQNFPGIYTIIFSKENHKGSFHTKNQKNLQRRLEDIGSKVHFLAKKGFFGYKNPPGGSKNFFDPNFFYWSSKWYGDLTSCKKSEKNIEQSRLQDRN